LLICPDEDRQFQYQQHQPSLDEPAGLASRICPDIVCLQELEAADGEFPAETIRQAGYHVVYCGERSWNGVAILARWPPVVTRMDLPGDDSDRQCGYLEAAVNGLLVTSIYAPSGNAQPGPKFDYKLAWLKRLHAHAAQLYASGVPVVLAGVSVDFRGLQPWLPS
jgi:exodeoxyribonuclease-3